MSINSVKKKINAKTLLGQSSALRENSEVLKKGVIKLASILLDRAKIKPSTLMATKEPEVVEQKRIGPGKYDKKAGGGLGLPPLLPTLAGLAALGTAFVLSPRVFGKRLLRAILKRAFGFVKAIGKRIFKVFRAIGRSIRKVFNSIRKFFKKIFNGISDNVKKLKNFFDDKLLRPIREAFENAINSKWFKKLRTFFDDIGTSIKNFIKNSAERFKTFADDIFTKIKTTVSDLVDRGIKAFKNILDEIADKILKPLKEAVLTFVERAKKRLGNVGQSIVSNVITPVYKKVIEPIMQSVTNSVTNLINNVKNTVIEKIDGIKNFQFKLPNFGVGPLRGQTVGLKDIPFGIGGRISGGLDDIKGGITKLFDGASNFVKNPIQSIRSTISTISTLGAEKFENLKKFGSEIQEAGIGASKQFKASLLDPIINGAKQFGESTANIGRSFGEKISSGIDYAKNLKLPNIGELFQNKVSDVFTKIKTPVQNAVIAPLMGAFDIGKGGVQAVGGALSAIAGGLKPAIDFMGNVKGGIGNFLGFIGKIPGISGLVNGFKKATTRFDQLFALGEAAVSYGLAVKTKNDGEPIDAGVLGKLKGQKIGNAVLTAAGGFFGSAIGSSIGTALGAGVLSAPLGFAGTVLGGMIGEEFGKFASVKIANALQENNIPNRDPFLSTEEKEIPIFDASEENLISAIESDGPAGIAKFFGFGGGEDTEEKPKAEGGPVPRPAFAKRRFDLMEDYTEYITDTEVVIITKESVVNNVVQTPMVQQSKGGMIPIPIGSGESILDNFRSRALSQLAYN